MRSTIIAFWFRWPIFINLQHYSHFLRASQNYSDGSAEEVQLPSGEELVTGDDSGPENDVDASNIPLNLVATQFAAD